jgi:hypothetical protein
MTEQQGRPVSRADWEDALRGFLIQAEADRELLLEPPVTGESSVRRRPRVRS